MKAASLISKCVQGDGVTRSFLGINFKLPAPTIHVCKDDIIVVDLTNETEGTATTLHWHGILQHKAFSNTPLWMVCIMLLSARFRSETNFDTPSK